MKKSKTKTENTNKPERNSSMLKNLAIFLSAFCVLSIFYFIVFGEIQSKTHQTTFYALAENTYTDKATAYAKAENIKTIGGSGNVWHYDNEYIVIAFVYNDEKSAKEVKNRLSSDSLNLQIEKLQIKTSKLETEEKLYVNSLIAISNRIYDCMQTLNQPNQETQIPPIIEEIKKSAITATARGEVLAGSKQTAQNIKITGRLIEDEFTQIATSNTYTTQSLSNLRTQILIYAYEFAKNY